MEKPSFNSANDNQDNTRLQLAAVIPPRSLTTAGAASSVARRSSGFNLPEGWRIEEVPRSTSSHVDKYYYEPGTGRKFRSLRAVERHLNGEEEKAPAPVPAPAPAPVEVADLKEDQPISALLSEVRFTKKPRSKTPHKGSTSKNSTEEEQQPQPQPPPARTPSSMPPEKVEWVLDASGPQGDIWKPFVNDRPVPDAIEQEWKEKFTLAVNSFSSSPDSTDPSAGI